jgi:hypothetical protein
VHVCHARTLLALLSVTVFSPIVPLSFSILYLFDAVVFFFLLATQCHTERPVQLLKLSMVMPNASGSRRYVSLNKEKEKGGDHARQLLASPRDVVHLPLHLSSLSTPRSSSSLQRPIRGILLPSLSTDQKRWYAGVHAAVLANLLRGDLKKKKKTDSRREKKQEAPFDSYYALCVRKNWSERGG